MSVRRMHRRDPRDRVDLTNDRYIGTKNHQIPTAMIKDSTRLAEPIEQGSNRHMAIKLLKAENANLEKIIIMLKTENQNIQTKMKELEYQNDRYKITQNQLKTELKRERDMVKYLHALAKKHERTIQKKDAEYRQLRREARGIERFEKPPEFLDKVERPDICIPPQLPPKRENPNRNKLTVQHIPNNTDLAVNPTSPMLKKRPEPPKRSASFNLQRNGRPFVIPKERITANAYNSDSALTETSSGSSSIPRCRSSDHIPSTKPDVDNTEWDDVTDVLGFLNEKVNQFERLLVESGGSNSSSETIEQGK
ncbi:uncharacterized protein LOC110241682 [Exaiptasia diaphana]|uniref:Uncharacterized protein n=1 Tax=Exaiptasia diaphana TaxID=2652724 RepID=A0A913XEI6_EXADI|nr:uncharacterized protein LOC110241682 [Exaiptasia diaphana]KXJ12742.1 hypothetical protein AC249_AIPGENE5461 [Exaiptasia diaphana]